MQGRGQIETYISAAVNAAVEACISGIDEKIQEAVNLGATIGAAAGAEVGAAAAARAIDREKRLYRKQQRDKRYHNTKLLLRHYRQLNEHYKHAIFDTGRAEEEVESFAEIMQSMNYALGDEALYVESIKQSCARTKIIMAHVNKMIEIYKIMCLRSNREADARHWRVIEALYIGDTVFTANEIAERERIDKRTVYKDVEACIDDLTVLFFGITGIEGA